MVRAEGVEPSSQAWEAHIIADILCPQKARGFNARALAPQSRTSGSRDRVEISGGAEAAGESGAEAPHSKRQYPPKIEAYAEGVSGGSEFSEENAPGLGGRLLG